MTASGRLDPRLPPDHVLAGLRALLARLAPRPPAPVIAGASPEVFLAAVAEGQVLRLPGAGGGGLAAGDPEVVDLVGRARDGSAQAFALLYDRYVDTVYGYVYHRVGHRQTAEDLVGDVFLRALQRVSGFRWQGVDFGAWLMTIARNRVHDHFKSARFRLEAPVEVVFDTSATVAADNPEQAALTADAARQVHAAMRELKGDQAEVLYLRFIHHLDVATTAAVMSRSEGAIKALQYRALRSLAKLVPDTLAGP